MQAKATSLCLFLLKHNWSWLLVLLLLSSAAEAQTSRSAEAYLKRGNEHYARGEIARVQSAQNQTAAPHTLMTLNVDASDAPMRILHATMAMSAKAGAMTLFYPKWIPGEQMASGPIANLTGLHIFADGGEIDWRRDLVEMNAFAITLPRGAK